MSNPLRLVALVGSLRKASLNRALLKEAICAAPATVRVEIVEIGDLPLYNGDVQDQGMPAAVTKLAESMAGADGVFRHSATAHAREDLDCEATPAK